MDDSFRPPENYYRVSLKALIFDDKGQLLVGKNSNGEYAIPGGGWDHGEDYESCIKREILEELGVETVSVGKVVCFYRCTISPGNLKVAIALPVKLANFRFVLDPEGGEAVEMRFVSKQEFAGLNFMEEESSVLACAEQIWSVVEKKSENR